MAIIAPLVHVLVDVIGALAKFFAIHFTKTMTVIGILIAVVLVGVFMATKEQ